MEKFKAESVEANVESAAVRAKTPAWNFHADRPDAVGLQCRFMLSDCFNKIVKTMVKHFSIRQSLTTGLNGCLSLHHHIAIKLDINSLMLRHQIMLVNK